MNIAIVCAAVDAPAGSFNAILAKIEDDCSAEPKCAGITLESLEAPAAVYFRNGFQFGKQKNKDCQKDLLPVRRLCLSQTNFTGQ